MDENSGAVVQAKRTKVVVFNRNKKIIYFGRCKIFLDSINKFLSTKLIDEDSTKYTYVSTFDKHFIAIDNFLCILNSITNVNLAIILPSKLICDKLFDAINKAQPQPMHNSLIEDGLFKSYFFIPILKEIQTGVTGVNDLKSDILELVNTFDSGKKEVYLNLLPETSFSPTSIKHEEIETSLNSTNNEVSGPTVASAGNAKTSLKRKRVTTDQLYQVEIVKLPNFELQNRKSNGKISTRLIVFGSSDKKLCYEFYESKCNKYFKCYQCEKMQYHCTAKLIKNPDEEEYVEMGARKHNCKPKKYQPQGDLTYKTVHKPYFTTEETFLNGGESERYLTITDAVDSGLKYEYKYSKSHKVYYCCECQRKKKSVTAKVLCNQNGEDYLRLNDAVHVCKE